MAFKNWDVGHYGVWGSACSVLRGFFSDYEFVTFETLFWSVGELPSVPNRMATLGVKYMRFVNIDLSWSLSRPPQTLTASIVGAGSCGCRKLPAEHSTGQY